jgi:adenylate cyclase
MTPSKFPADQEISNPDSSFSPELIQEHLDQLMNAEEFLATKAQRELLRFVVDKTLAGQCDEIKGYTIATEVFGRGEDFDQATDPIVSIQANKLRRALDFYYLKTAADDLIRIDIPKGTYVPVFHLLDTASRGTLLQENHDIGQCSSNDWIKIIVQPFKNLSENSELDYFGIGIASEIAQEITRFQEVRVLVEPPQGVHRRATDVGARFVLTGYFKKDKDGLKVGSTLIDKSTDLQIWHDTQRMAFDPARLVDYEEEIALKIACKLFCEDGVMLKTLSPETKKVPLEDLRTYQAILHYYQFQMEFSPQAFLSAYEALERVCQREPECGLAWSLLARLYAVNFSLELFDLDTPLEKAAAFAQKGLVFTPTSQRTRLTMAYILLLQNELSAGLAEIHKAIKLNPKSLMFLDRIGYLMALLGDWEQGTAIIKKAMAANPYYNATVPHALWVDWIRQGNYEQAYLETLDFRLPGLFWEPLMKAVTMGFLGRETEGRRAVDDLLKCKPDFAHRGRTLIEYYIKFDDIVARMIDGLSRAGLDIV